MFASFEGHTEVVNVLADSKADLNITDEVNLMTYTDYTPRCVL